MVALLPEMVPGRNRTQGETAMHNFKATMAAAAAVLWMSSSALAASVCGDVNSNSTVTSTDALLVLRSAVGQPVTLNCPPYGQPPKTGQTDCFNAAGDTVSCSTSGQEGDVQNGLARSFTDNGNGTVTDNASGLTWEKLSDDGSVHDRDNVYSWVDGFAKIAALNGANFAGHSDWRMPNRFELEQLVRLDVIKPSTYAQFHTNCSIGCTVLTCSCTRFNYYWTSSTFESDSVGAWAVDFYDAFLSSILKTDTLGVRAVRGRS